MKWLYRLGVKAGYKRGYEDGYIAASETIQRDARKIVEREYARFVQSDTGQEWLHRVRQYQLARHGMQ